MGVREEEKRGGGTKTDKHNCVLEYRVQYSHEAIHTHSRVQNPIGILTINAASGIPPPNILCKVNVLNGMLCVKLHNLFGLVGMQSLESPIGVVESRVQIYYWQAGSICIIKYVQSSECPW